ncbi:MAG: acetolactate synthase small subunit [Odoribacter sp.]|nr:acetolactate synthase small subunit [Odoribacter sp.]
MNKEYILTIFSENKVGLLSQITTAFTYRNINIESMTVSESAINGIHKYTVFIHADPEKVEKLAKQIEKKIEVLKVFVFTPDEVVQQEIALYKAARNKNIENLVREHHVRILEIDDNYIILEKSGHKHETQALFKLLQPYGVHQFVRSGLVAVSKSKKELLTDFLKAQTAQSNN